MSKRSHSKNTLLFVLLATVALFTFAAGPVFAWDTELVEVNSTLQDYPRSEIVVDSAGNTHIVFAIEVTGPLAPYPQLQYAFYNGSTWTVQDVDGAFAPIPGMGMNFTFNLALDSANHPHITYFNGTDIHHTISLNSGIDWTDEIYVSGIAGENFTPVHDFVIGDDDTEYLLYVTSVVGPIPSEKIYLKSQAPHTTWADLLEYNAGTNEISEMTLAAKAGVVAFVSTWHQVVTGGPGTLYSSGLEHWDTASGVFAPVFPVINSFTMLYNFASSLALDASGNSHVSYITTADNTLHYAIHTGVAGAFIETPLYTGPTDPLQGVTDIAVDANNYPHIVYSERSGEFNYVLKYAKQSGAGWTNENAAAAAFGGEEAMPSLALDLTVPAVTNSHVSHVFWAPSGEGSDPSLGHTFNAFSSTYYTLTVDPPPSHGNVVEESPGSSIHCGSSSDLCDAEYAAGTNVSLHALADDGYTFDSWSGDCGTPEGTYASITMDSDKTCTANFIALTPLCVDDDEDGYAQEGPDPLIYPLCEGTEVYDCDDTDNAIYPGAPEIAGDGIDQNCDGIDPVNPADPDPDDDGIPIAADNCPTVYNPPSDCDENPLTPDEQCDWDGDGLGNACDFGTNVEVTLADPIVFEGDPICATAILHWGGPVGAQIIIPTRFNTSFTVMKDGNEVAPMVDLVPPLIAIPDDVHEITQEEVDDGGYDVSVENCDISRRYPDLTSGVYDIAAKYTNETSDPDWGEGGVCTSLPEAPCLDIWLGSVHSPITQLEVIRSDDSDPVDDHVDNCPGVDNPGQADNDEDGLGDACDPGDATNEYVMPIVSADGLITATATFVWGGPDGAHIIEPTCYNTSFTVLNMAGEVVPPTVDLVPPMIAIPDDVITVNTGYTKIITCDVSRRYPNLAIGEYQLVAEYSNFATDPDLIDGGSACMSEPEAPCIPDIFVGSVKSIGDTILSITGVPTGTLILQTDLHFVGPGPHPGINKQGIIMETGVFDKSQGSCAASYGISWQSYEDIWDNCDSVVAHQFTNGMGQTAYNNLPAEGNYLVIGLYMEGTTEIYTGRSVGSVDLTDMKKKYLQIINKTDNKKVPAKYKKFTGSELLIIEPEYVEWSSDTELYPIVLASEGDWSVNVAVEPPEGFVADHQALSEEVNSTVGAVQFTITDVGSKWVHTKMNYKIKHKGKTQNMESQIGMKLAPGLAKKKGLGIFGEEDLRPKHKAEKNKKKNN